MRKIPNYYDDSKITEKTMKMARKVTLTCEKIADIPLKINPDYEQEYWNTTLTYKGRQYNSIYLVPVGISERPRIEYVLNSLFCNSALYDKYNGNVFELINDFAAMFGGDFGRAEHMNKSLESASKGIHNLFREDFDLYKKEFIKINDFEHFIERRE